MFDRQSLHIALLMWGCIFNLIAALCMFMSKNFDRQKRKWMLCMQLSSAVLLGSDAVAWAFRGVSGQTGYLMVRISNFLVFALSDVMLLLFHGYVCCYLFEKVKPGKRQNLRIKAVYLIALTGIFLVVLSQFTHFYYYFDADNFYRRNPAYVLSCIIPMAGLLLDLSLLIQYRKNISRDIFVSMLSYIALPVLAMVAQIFYYGFSSINLSICIAMILMFVVSMVEQNRNLAYKEKEAADLRISLMLSQIAPHFIYNTLTTIQGLCEKDPKLAKETVGEFSTYLRGNLTSLSETGLIPFAKELEHIQCYCAIEKKRFGDRVHVEYEIAVKEFMLPPLTLQPLVENAIKHGICKKEGGGTVWIRTERKANSIYLIVQDDGVGFNPKEKRDDGEKHVGLINVSNRLESMCHGKLEYRSRVGTGTMAVITLPQD